MREFTTVIEHLQQIGTLKNMHKDDLERRIEHVMAVLNLEKYKNTYS